MNGKQIERRGIIPTTIVVGIHTYIKINNWYRYWIIWKMNHSLIKWYVVSNPIFLI